MLNATLEEGQYYPAIVAKNAAGETALALALARGAPDEVDRTHSALGAIVFSIGVD